MERLTSLANRALFLLALVLAGLAVWEKLANTFGYTLTFIRGYAPSRFLEFAAVALLFVITLQLREQRHGGTTG